MTDFVSRAADKDSGEQLGFDRQSAAKSTAERRLDRILAMVPWIVAHNGPTVLATCERFGCSPSELARDIELLYLCGLHPFTPDLLIEAGIADGRVFIQYAEYLSRPLRLTPSEGLALVASATSLLSTPGTDPEGPLARGLNKLAAVVGTNDVDIDLGNSDDLVHATLARSISSENQTDINYYAYGRDETSWRRIETISLFSNSGAWYVSAYCHQAQATRVFRLDRILDIAETDVARTLGRELLPAVEFKPGAGGAIVQICLAPSAAWVKDQYPIEDWIELADGNYLATLRVNEWPWLERLLLRLGPQAVVTRAPNEWLGLSRVASAIRQRYRLCKNLDGDSRNS